MKAKIEFEVDFYEEREMLQHMLSAQDYHSIIHEVYNLIRNRLKHCEDVTEKEEQFLRELMDYVIIE